MKYLALAAAGAAAIAGLTGCSYAASSATAPTSAPTGTHSAAPTGTHSAAAVNCSQQYKTWKDGGGKGLVAAVTAVGSAATTGDMQVISTALEKAKPAVARAGSNPMPACADPKSYWGVLLMHVNAATNTRSASSIRAAIKGVPTVQRELMAELTRLTG